MVPVVVVVVVDGGRGALSGRGDLDTPQTPNVQVE